jgi:hypothetical protein
MRYTTQHNWIFTASHLGKHNFLVEAARPSDGAVALFLVDHCGQVATLGDAYEYPDRRRIYPVRWNDISPVPRALIRLELSSSHRWCICSEDPDGHSTPPLTARARKERLKQ